MAAQEFHHFPKIPELVKVIVLKKLDLETLLSFALTSKNAVKLVRKCAFTPSLVEIRLQEKDPWRTDSWTRNGSRCIDVSFEPGTFPEGYNDFTWNFVDSSEKLIKKAQLHEKFNEPNFLHKKYVMDDGVVLKNLFQIENIIGCEVSPQNFDKVYTRIEHLLLTELFRPAQKVVVNATEGIVANLGNAFSSRNKPHVHSLYLDQRWSDTKNLRRILEGYEVDKLELPCSVDYEKVNWREIRAPAKTVHFSGSDLFTNFGLSALLPFNFEEAFLDCDLHQTLMLVKAWRDAVSGLQNLSLLTAMCGRIEQGYFANAVSHSEIHGFFGLERVDDQFVVQTDVSSDKAIRIFHIQNGYQIRRREDGKHAFYWLSGERNYHSPIVHFLVWSSKFRKVSRGEAKRIVKERNQEIQKKLSDLGEEPKYEYRRPEDLTSLENTILWDEAKIEERRKRIEAYDGFLESAQRAPSEEKDHEEQVVVDEHRFATISDFEIIRNSLVKSLSEATDLAKLLPTASLYKFTIFTERFYERGSFPVLEIEITNTTTGEMQKIEIIEHHKLEDFQVHFYGRKLDLEKLPITYGSAYYFTEKKRQKAGRRIWNRFQTLYPTAEFSLTLSADFREKNARLMKVKVPKGLHCTTVTFEGEWSVGELEKTLKCLSIGKSIKFSGDFSVKEGKIPPEMMPFVDQIVIDGARKVQFAQWIPKCREIRIENGHQENVGDFVKEVIENWKEGKLESTFESMLCKSNFDNPDELLEEFDGKPWDPSLRSGVFCNLSDSQEMISHDLRMGLDFQRSSDGSLATLLISNDVLKFIAWKKGAEFNVPCTRDIRKWKEVEVEKMEPLLERVIEIKKEAKMLRWKWHESKRKRRAFNEKGAIKWKFEADFEIV